MARERDERWALGVLCEHAVRLRDRAEADGWRDEWDNLLGLLHSGGSALTALQQLGLTDIDFCDAPEVRSGFPNLPGLPQVSVRGSYVCPKDRCARRADRDERRQPPTCYLDQAPMRFNQQI